MGAGASATDSFNYTVSDGHGGTATATVNVAIAGVNDAPTANNDSGFTANQTAVKLIPIASLLANDTDPDTNTSSGFASTAVRGKVCNSGYQPTKNYSEVENQFVTAAVAKLFE